VNLLYIAIGVLVALIAAGGLYYMRLIKSYKNFISFEHEILKNPSDEGIDAYMEQFEKAYIPTSPKIMVYRTKFYQSIKGNPNVSYNKKRELGAFFKSKGISTLSLTKENIEIEED